MHGEQATGSSGVAEDQPPESKSPSVPTAPQPDRTLDRFVLTRGHQRLVAIGLGMLLVAFSGYLAAGAWRFGWVDIDSVPATPARFQVDINSAPWFELVAVPGIGEVLARRIVEHRTVHGPFQDHAELTEVPGIGPHTATQLQPYLLPLNPGGQ